MTEKDKCVVCIASRKRPVDIFFEGFKAGFRTGTTGRRTEPDLFEVEQYEAPMCLEHDKMLTEAYVEVLREVTDRKGY